MNIIREDTSGVSKRPWRGQHIIEVVHTNNVLHDLPDLVEHSQGLRSLARSEKNAEAVRPL